MPTATTRPAIRSLEGWAIAILRETGALIDCERHGWMQDRGDPHALIRALAIARDDPPRGFCSPEAIEAIENVLLAVGDSCPDCSRPDDFEAVAGFK